MPKRIDVAEQRRMIADAAIAVIDRTGLEGARLRDVARAANVTTGAVTHYFDGKDAVLEGTLKAIARRMLARMETPGEPLADGDIAAFIGRLCRHLPTTPAHRAEWRVWLAFKGHAIADDHLRAIQCRHSEAMVDRLTGPLQALAGPAPGPTPDRVRKCADAVMAAIDGVGTRAVLEPELWPAKRQRETLVGLLLPLLTAFARGTGTGTGGDYEVR